MEAFLLRTLGLRTSRRTIGSQLVYPKSCRTPFCFQPGGWVFTFFSFHLPDLLTLCLLAVDPPQPKTPRLLLLHTLVNRPSPEYPVRGPITRSGLSFSFLTYVPISPFVTHIQVHPSFYHHHLRNPPKNQAMSSPQQRLWSKRPSAASALWVKPTPAAQPQEHQHSPNAKPLSSAEARVRNPGKRFAQIVKLKPEHYAEYKKCHAAVWPEVAKQIKNCNIVDCTYETWRFRRVMPCPGDVP